MAISVECDDCGKKYRLPDRFAGKRVSCEKCGSKIRVPTEDEVYYDPVPLRRSRSTAASRKKAAKSSAMPWILGGMAVGAVGFSLLFAVIFAFFSPRQPSSATSNDSAITSTATTPNPLADTPKSSVGQPSAVATPASTVGAPAVAPATNAATTAAASPPAAPAAPAMADAGNSQQGLPLEIMQALKASTVYVKTEIGPISFSGSGFVMSQDGDTTLIATNNHVVSKPKELQLGGYIPGLRGRSRMALTRLQATVANSPPVVTVVFNSGTPEEQAIKAEITAGTDDPDLAILKVTGVRQKVTPLNYNDPPVLNETMPVYMFGFPFGDALATGKGNPAITVGKGSVSSIRRNDAGKIAKVQIDGALNPGNSGGPVVDSKGGLVGIAVQTIQGSNIGLAIHPPELGSLLGGKVGPTTLTTAGAGKGQSAVELTFTVNDPLGKLRSVSVDYVPKAIVVDQTQLEQPQVKGVDGALTIQATREGNGAKALLLLTPDKESQQISVQVAFVNADGATVYSPPQVLWMGPAADNQYTTITTVSTNQSTVTTRIEQRGNRTNRNVVVTRGGGTPPKVAALIPKPQSAASDKSNGGFNEGSKKESSKSDDDEMSAKSKKKGESDEPAAEGEVEVKWTNSIKKMAGNIPDAEVSGKLGGEEFHPDKIVYAGQTLTFRQGSGFFADLELSLVTFKSAGDLAGKKCVVNGQVRVGDPHARVGVMKKDDRLPDTTPHMNYLMVLEFGEYDEELRTLSGKIYICFPDKAKSVCAGTFDANVQ